MIYLFSLVICICLAWVYDICGYSKNKQVCYNILLIWFILVSGFQYMVGSDTELYMEKFKQFPLDLSLGTFIERSEDRQQPGWVLISWICRQFTDDFFLMKLIQATFYNVAVFSFFKRESKYLFFCVLLYAMSAYLVTNFNVLRQSYAVAFGLYAISYINRDKYLKFFFFVLFAYMFHSSALLLFVIPIFKVVKSKKMTILFASSLLLIALYTIFTIDYMDIIANVLNAGVFSDTTSAIAVDYLKDENLGVLNREAGFSLNSLFILIVVFYYIFKQRDLFWGGIGIVYFIVYVIAELMPILWRYRLFFEFSFFMIFASIIVEYSKSRFNIFRYPVCVVILLLYFFLFPYTDLFSKAPGAKRYIDQYYPYHSIFDPIKEKRV